MNDTDKAICELEEYYCSRMDYLVERDKFDYAHSIFEEFVVDGEEPEEYLFVKFIADEL